MIVYRDQHSRTDPRALLSKLESRVANSASAPTHDCAVQTLIEVGVLESAIADATFPESDGIHTVTNALRGASLAAAHVLWHTWHEKPTEARSWWGRLEAALKRLHGSSLPSEVEVAKPEGYAFYSVYPEMYLAAAKDCVARLGRITGVCLGLRSIGTSLSAVVVAALEELGCAVDSFTLRPRGHPFSRYPCLQPGLASELVIRREGYFLLVDEGPGISGSSLGGTAALLRSWGISDDRILVFPSRRTDGSQLRSSVARDHWARHRQFTVSFEDIWIHSGRLQRAFPGELRDVSAGGWRQAVYSEEHEYPAVQPQHERRKYLLTSSELAGSQRILSFGGLPGVGADIVRMERLAEAGFTVDPDKVAHGFVQRRFVAGRPVARGTADPALLDTAARYLAHLSREHQTEPTTSCALLRDMTAVNVAEGLDELASERLVPSLPAGEWIERPVALDGRMLPHEWIHTAHGYLKVDAIDHHDDHFFPGSQDIAWDVAAAVVEFGLSNAERHRLICRYRALSGDGSIGLRLRPYTVAYLAFRLGYSHLAASVLGEHPDGYRFSSDVERYTHLLRREIQRCSSSTAI